MSTTKHGKRAEDSTTCTFTCKKHEKESFIEEANGQRRSLSNWIAESLTSVIEQRKAMDQLHELDEERILAEAERILADKKKANKASGIAPKTYDPSLLSSSQAPQSKQRKAKSA